MVLAYSRNQEAPQRFESQLAPASEFRVARVRLRIARPQPILHKGYCDRGCRVRKRADPESTHVLLFFSTTRFNIRAVLRPASRHYYLYSGFSYIYVLSLFLLRRITSIHTLWISQRSRRLAADGITKHQLRNREITSL